MADFATVFWVQSGQAAGLMAFGDGVAQGVEHCMADAPVEEAAGGEGDEVPEPEKPVADGDAAPAAGAVAARRPCFNCQRWWQMIGLNVIFQGITQYYFYVWLEVVFPGLSWAAVVKKMILDQFLYNPASNAAIMWSQVAIDKGSDEACVKLKSDFVTAMLPSWIMWVPGDIINFKYMPKSAQVAFYNAVNSIYLIYFSWITNQPNEKTLALDDKGDDEEEEAAPGDT